MRRIYRKIRSTSGGLNFLIGILLFLIAVMLILIAVPSWQRFSYRSQKVGCDQAMKSARDGLIIEYLGSLKKSTTEEAMRDLDKIMPARENLCPAGGNIYLTEGEDGYYVPVCGIHGNDKKQKTRLNGSYAKILLEKELSDRLRRSKKEKQDSISITLNSQPLDCVHVLKKEFIHRGTASTNGYEGIVAFYGLEGEGDFETGQAEEGELAYFVYADENYCAIWWADQGWSGDAYS